MKRSLSIVFVSAALAGLAQPAVAQSSFPGLQTVPPPAQSAPQSIVEPAAPAKPLPPIDDRVAFNHPERWIVRDYFARIREDQLRASRSKVHKRALPAGLSQPPAKGDILPSAAIAAMRSLPGPLIRQLPPARPDTLRRIAGKDVLMLRASTGEVLDVLDNVVF